MATTKINYSVNVSLYSKVNENQNEKGKDGNPLSPKVVTVFNNRVSVSIKADAPLTVAQLKAEVRKKLEIQGQVEESVKFKGNLVNDADVLNDVTVEYIATADKSGVEATTTTTAAPTTTTTTEAPTTTTTVAP